MTGLIFPDSMSSSRTIRVPMVLRETNVVASGLRTGTAGVAEQTIRAAEPPAASGDDEVHGARAPQLRG
jgi:hypothetical protein